MLYRTRDWEMKENALFFFPAVARSVLHYLLLLSAMKGKSMYYMKSIDGGAIETASLNDVITAISRFILTIIFWYPFDLIYVRRSKDMCIELSVINVMIGLICSVRIWLCSISGSERASNKKRKRERERGGGGEQRKTESFRFARTITHSHTANRSLYDVRSSVNQR